MNSEAAVPATRDPRDARRFVLLLALVAVVHVAYLLESASLPFMVGPTFDSLVYLRQAESVRQGRFGDPSLLAFSPLYGWFLAMFRESRGFGVYATQASFGVLTAVFVRFATARRFGARAGDLAMVATSAYGMLRFYETKLMSDTLGLVLLAAWVALPTAPRDETPGAAHAGRSFARGVLVAAATLARASLAFALVLAPLAEAFDARPLPGRTRVLRVAACGLGIALVLGGNGATNLHTTGHFVPIVLRSSTLARANSASATGSFEDFGRGETPPSAWDVVVEAREHLAGRRVASDDARFSFATFARLAPRRLVATWRNEETTHDYGYYGERTELASFHLAPLSFVPLAAIGLAGLALARKRDPSLVARAAVVIVGVQLVTLLFYATSRYRLPLALPLCIGFGIGLDAALVAWTETRRALPIALAALVILVGAVGLETHRLASPGMWHLRVAESAHLAGDRDEFARRLRLARAARPNDPSVERRIRLWHIAPR